MLKIKKPANGSKYLTGALRINNLGAMVPFTTIFRKLDMEMKT